MAHMTIAEIPICTATLSGFVTNRTVFDSGAPDLRRNSRAFFTVRILVLVVVGRPAAGGLAVII